MRCRIRTRGCSGPVVSRTGRLPEGSPRVCSRGPIVVGASPAAGTSGDTLGVDARIAAPWSVTVRTSSLEHVCPSLVTFPGLVTRLATRARVAALHPDRSLLRRVALPDDDDLVAGLQQRHRGVVVTAQCLVANDGQDPITLHVAWRLADLV